MSGYTIRSLTTILTTLFQDAQASGAINPQDARDAFGSLSNVFTTTQTVAFAPAATDVGSVIRCNFSSPANVTINTGIFTAGQQFGLRWVGTSQPTIVQGSGVTLITASSLTLRAIGSLAVITCDTAANTFYVDGDLT